MAGMGTLRDPCAHPAGTRLALKLVEEQFGDVCKVRWRAWNSTGARVLGAGRWLGPG